MIFKDISIFRSGGHFVRRSKHFVQLCSGHYEEHFCEIILNLERSG